MKFWHTVAKLDIDTQEDIQEFLLGRHGDNHYQALKDKLCSVFKSSAEQKLDQFLAISVMGDKKPSTFAREIQRLVAGMTINDVAKTVFTCSLPPRIATAVAGDPSVSLDELAEAADRAWCRTVRETGTGS